MYVCFIYTYTSLHNYTECVFRNVKDVGGGGGGGWVGSYAHFMERTNYRTNPDYIVSNLKVKVSSVLEACNQHFLCWPLRPDGQNS